MVQKCSLKVLKIPLPAFQVVAQSAKLQHNITQLSITSTDRYVNSSSILNLKQFNAVSELSLDSLIVHVEMLTEVRTYTYGFSYKVMRLLK